MDVVTGEGVAKDLKKEYLQFPLGADAVQWFRGKAEVMMETVEAMGELGRGIECDDMGDGRIEIPK